MSARHLVMLQVHRLAMFLTDKNCVICMYQYFFYCDTFWQSILELDTHFY
jgi:hypothetical protein